MTRASWPPTVAQLRADASEHARQIEAVLWISAQDLAKRWGVSPVTVRAISREKLPYLQLGGTRVRRYDPRDVEAFEDREKRGGGGNDR